MNAVFKVHRYEEDYAGIALLDFDSGTLLSEAPEGTQADIDPKMKQDTKDPEKRPKQGGDDREKGRSRNKMIPKRKHH